jgi:hypothetical protein
MYRTRSSKSQLLQENRERLWRNILNGANGIRFSLLSPSHCYSASIHSFFQIGFTQLILTFRSLIGRGVAVDSSAKYNRSSKPDFGVSACPEGMRSIKL